jgi:TonB family protein
VDVDPQGRVVGASVLEPLRENDPHGFADAAIEVARHSQFSNPNAAVTSMKFMVKFAPASAPPSGNVRLTVVPDPDDFYPDAARQANVSGSAIVQVAVDPKGRIVDVSVLETRPAGDSYGFGAAAVEVARKSQYSNPGTEISSIKFMVKFDNRT